MQIDKSDGEVRIWWDYDEDRRIPPAGPRYTLSDDEERTIERDPDLLLTDRQADRLVIELLRGPSGPQGPMGAMGVAGLPGRSSGERGL